MEPASPSLRPFRAGYWFGGFNGLTWMMSLGTPMVLLLEQLGGSSFQVGLASSFVFVLYPIQVLATALLERLGFQRQMVLAWGIRAVFLVVPLALAWLAPERPEPWMANAVVGSVFLFCFCRAFGVAAHVPWFSAILPDGLRGRYWATEGAITSTVGVGALLSCTALFAVLPTYAAFRCVYGIAIFGSVMAVTNLTRLPPGPRPPASPLREMTGETVRLCLGVGLFRHYLTLSLIGAVATSSFSAFTSYYLKAELGLASSAILSFTAATFGGQILGAWTIRQWIDRVAIRRFFQFANGVLCCVFGFWLLVVQAGAPAIEIFAAAYFAFGVATGVANTTHMTFLPELSPVEKRPVSIAVFGAVSGLASGLGPMLWGLALRPVGPQPGIDPGSFAVYFGVGVALCALVVVLMQRLPDPRLPLVAEPSRT